MIDASVLAAFLQPTHIVIIVILYILGMRLKKLEGLKDNLIPVVLTIVSFVICIVYALSVNPVPVTLQGSMGMVFNVIIQSVLCAAGAVYFNQIGKQLIKLKSPEEIPLNKKDD